MTVITRFSPSANGSLHLGHVYALLVNERFAHETSGKFFVRFDDTSQAIYVEMEHPERVDKIIAKQKKDIKWLGIDVDGWERQSDLLKEVHKEMTSFGYGHLTDVYPHDLPQSVRFGSAWIPYPYTANQTAERVLMDYNLGITHVIRGEDFLTEYALYRYFCEVFHKPAPQFIFLPRLSGLSGDISKTNGGYKISDFRASGYSPEDVIMLLEKSCLIWWKRGWNLYNLKSNPRIDL
jgi:glutamyl/glutaminyl-tRNA synthetase